MARDDHLEEHADRFRTAEAFMGLCYASTSTGGHCVPGEPGGVTLSMHHDKRVM